MCVKDLNAGYNVCDIVLYFVHSRLCNLSLTAALQRHMCCTYLIYLSLAFLSLEAPSYLRTLWPLTCAFTAEVISRSHSRPPTRETPAKRICTIPAISSSRSVLQLDDFIHALRLYESLPSVLSHDACPRRSTRWPHLLDTNLRATCSSVVLAEPSQGHRSATIWEIRVARASKRCGMRS